MINKIYSMIGHFFLRRTDEYWEDRDFNESGEFTSGASTKGTRYTGLNKYASHQLTPDTEPSYNIRIYSAKGGRVVECHTSTTQANQQFKNEIIDLYVIPDGTELVDVLGKILMLHSLTKK